jgi:hypothetical protein
VLRRPDEFGGYSTDVLGNIETVATEVEACPLDPDQFVE